MFVIFAEPTIASKPSKSAFNDPTHGHGDKAFLARRGLSNFKLNAVQFSRQPGEKGFTQIGAISPNFLQARTGGGLKLGDEQFGPSRS